MTGRHKNKFQFLKVLMLCIVFLSFGIIFALSMPPKTPPKEEVAASQPGSRLEGKPAPLFTLTSLNSTPVHLANLKGKVVLINFWATWCAPCKEEMPSMQHLYDKMKKKPFEILAVSVDHGDVQVIHDFLKAETTAYTFPILRDPEEKISKGTYHVTGVPETFIIGKDGNVIKHVIGAFEWDKPDVVRFFEDKL